jgi:hypothetical protein
VTVYSSVFVGGIVASVIIEVSDILVSSVSKLVSGTLVSVTIVVVVVDSVSVIFGVVIVVVVVNGASVGTTVVTVLLTLLNV